MTPFSSPGADREAWHEELQVTDVIKEGFQSIGETIRETQLPRPFVPYNQRPELPMPANVPKGYPPPPAPSTMKGVALE